MSCVLSLFGQFCAELHHVAGREMYVSTRYSVRCCSLRSYPSSPFTPQRETTENVGMLK